MVRTSRTTWFRVSGKEIYISYYKSWLSSTEVLVKKDEKKEGKKEGSLVAQTLYIGCGRFLFAMRRLKRPHTLAAREGDQGPCQIRLKSDPAQFQQSSSRPIFMR
jgi:hypothetical protein